MDFTKQWRFDYGALPIEFSQIDTYRVASILFELTVLKNAQRVLELGVGGWGTSTQVFLKALERTGGKLISVDIDERTRNWHTLKGAIYDQLPNHWTFIAGDSKMVDVRGEFDIILIDTSHEIEQTKEELKLYVPKTKQGGYILMHDYNLEEVKMPTHFYLNDNPDKVSLCFVYGPSNQQLAVLRKL